MYSKRSCVKSLANYLWAALAATAIGGVAEAAIVEIFTENLDAFNEVQDLGDGMNPYGVQILTAPTAFGTGDAMRMIDFYDMDKPELQGELAAPLLEPFRIDFQSINESPASSSSAIRFRMANSGQSITSESRSAFSLSWQADKKVSAKYNGSADGNTGDVDTTSSDPLEGLSDITLIANGATAGTYAYSLFGETRTLNPLSYDVYIDGALLNSSTEGDPKHDEFKNGMLFHFESSGNYDPNLGLQRFGLLGSSDSNVDPDVSFDNVILRTGSDIGAAIPEPSSLVMLLAGLSAIGLFRTR